MTRLLRAEWRKLFSTKLWWGMLLGEVALVAVIVIGVIGRNGGGGGDALQFSAAVGQQTLFSVATGRYIFPLVVGVIMMTTEFRHFTSRPTFLISPHRGQVILAKFVLAFAVGILYAVVCIAALLAIAVPWLSAKGITIHWFDYDLVLVLIGDAVGVCIFTMVGVGVGVLIRNQVAAVMTSLAFLLIVESAIASIPVIDNAYRYTPSAVADALTAYGTIRRGQDLLDPWQGGLLLLGWGLLFTVLGWVLTVRRDVD